MAEQLRGPKSLSGEEHVVHELNLFTEALQVNSASSENPVTQANNQHVMNQSGIFKVAFIIAGSVS